MTNLSLPHSSKVSDFASRHSLSVSSVYRLIRSNKLRAFKVNSAMRIPEIDERLWLDSALESEQEKS